MATTAKRMSAEERREQLLDVLAGVVLTEGFGAVSIDRVARDAPIARTVVYSHFGNLEGMLVALLERAERRALTQVRAAVPGLAEGAEPDEVLSGGVRLFTAMVHADPDTWRLVLFPPDGAPVEVRERIAAGREGVRSLLEPLVAWAVEKRDGPEGFDVELLSRVIVSLGEEGARLVVSRPDRYPPQRLSDFTAELLRLLARPG